MHIGLISTLGGGVGRVTNNLIRGLSPNKEIEFYLFRVDRLLDYNPETPASFRLKYYPMFESPLLAKVKSLIDLSIKRFDLDIIHCNYASNAAFLRRYERNLILTLHGFPRPELESGFYKLAYSFEQLCLSWLPNNLRIITISEYCKNLIHERYDLSPEVIYNGIDIDFFCRTPNRNIIKQMLGLQGKKVILYVGRLISLKDPITLIKSYRQLVSRIDDTVLIIVGNGPLEERIMKLVSYYDLRVIFKQGCYGKDLLHLFQCADLFVLPSIGESFGLALTEAMACGCPSIASNSGACPEILGTKDLLFEPMNIKSLSEKMIYLLQNPNESQKVSEYLERRARMLFSYKDMCAKYYEVYRAFK